MPRKCVCLYSGGLDSRLIIKIMAEQDVEVVVFHGLHCFESKEPFDEIREKVERDCLALGAAKVIFRDMTPNILKLLKKNRYGFGKNLNPCLDCRINTIRTAAEVMREEGADFLASGEVLGQRPKSQQSFGMQTVLDETIVDGLTGLILRPLCARLLEPTIPETEKWVDREKLFDISGRSRNRQFELAENFGIADYPTPAGGCLLTDAGFCMRMRELLEKNENITNEDIDLLKFGRHYRSKDGTLIIAARSEYECDRILQLSRNGDKTYYTFPRPGALVLARGVITEEDENIACGLAVFYSKHRQQGYSNVRCSYTETSNEVIELTEKPVVDPADIAEYKIG